MHRKPNKYYYSIININLAIKIRICSYPKKLFHHDLALVILKFIYDLHHCFFASIALSSNNITSFCIRDMNCNV